MMVVHTCSDCPYKPGCSDWGKCSVTRGDGVMYKQTLNGSCKSSFQCNNRRCLDKTTSVVTTTKDNVPLGDPMLTVKVAIPVVAAVVLIAVVLVFFFLRRKRRNDATQSAKALNSLHNVPVEEKHLYSVDNIAFSQDFDMALEEREYNYDQSHSSGKGLSDYTYAKPTKSYQTSEKNVGSMKNMAASLDTEYDYACAKQMILVGNDRAVYNRLSHGQLLNDTKVGGSTYDTNQFPILQLKSDPSDYDHLGRGVAKITDNHGDEESYDHLPSPDQTLSSAYSQPYDTTYNQLGSV
ncbi:uncharacterized protein LOC127862318 isoform X3 [Dreissena polymorpha]|uniref:uncharacterized protein LOC127862318 isoform X3 n=1 Tax=Dreissena polymorpha TaxID=45954 RepID=UPI002264CC0A|nr:uncharacterized protein LOC127862318 isoform X3 [Dreissena polymorpha]